MLEQLVEKTTITDFFIITIGSIALVSFWRGVWGLMDLYLFPNSPNVSYWLSIIFGLIILLLIALYRKDRFKKVAKTLDY